MSNPLPDLPDNPLGSPPANPLGAPPAPPLGRPTIGHREPLRFPNLRQRLGRGRSTKPPVPTLTERAQRRAAAPVVQVKQPTPPPPAKAPKPAQSAKTAPIAPPPQAGPQAGPQAAPRRRTAQEVRDAQREAIAAFLGPQVANHPLMGSAAYRDRLSKFSAAHARGHQQRALDAALAQAQADVAAAQRANPGYKPRNPQQPAAASPASPDPGMPPAVKAKRAAQYQQIRATMDALRQPPKATPALSQPPTAASGDAEGQP